MRLRRLRGAAQRHDRRPVRLERGLPERLVSDNGPEFTGQAVDSWAYQRGVQWQFIEPGKPVQNAYIESFNGKEVTVDAVRSWMETLPYGSLFSNWSVKIINELDRCSKDAQDILLSYLDRLPPGKALIDQPPPTIQGSSGTVLA